MTNWNRLLKQRLGTKRLMFLNRRRINKKNRDAKTHFLQTLNKNQQLTKTLTLNFLQDRT